MSNSSGYPSLHDDLGRAGAPDKNGRYYFPTTTVKGKLFQCRVFIPPGSRFVSFIMYRYDTPEAVIRYKKPPTKAGFPSTLPLGTVESLELLQSSDQHIIGPRGKLTIFSHSVNIPQGDGGWLYASVDTGDGSGGTFFETQYLIAVDAGEYNKWYDSIQWSDVEGKTTYGPALPPDVPVDPGPVVTPPVDPIPEVPKDDAFTCLLKGGKMVNGVCVIPVTPEPIPAKLLPEIRMTILDTPIKITLDPYFETAVVIVGDAVYTGIPFTVQNLVIK